MGIQIGKTKQSKARLDKLMIIMWANDQCSRYNACWWLGVQYGSFHSPIVKYQSNEKSTLLIRPMNMKQSFVSFFHSFVFKFVRVFLVFNAAQGPTYEPNIFISISHNSFVESIPDSSFIIVHRSRSTHSARNTINKF